MLLVISACSDIHLMNKAPAIRSVSVKIAHYCPTNGRSFVNVFALNLSTQTATDQILLDTDRDGLSDNFEQNESVQDEYNISLISPDTNSDGYSDLFAYNNGLDIANQQNLAVCLDLTRDTDRDLLTDCEESILGTDANDPDTDKDGIPDGLEFRFGLNAFDIQDSGLDSDGDGYNNLEEIINNSLVNTSQDAQILKHKLDYKIDAYMNQDNEQCFEVTVSNIPIVNVSNGNMIKVMFLESEAVEGQGQANFIRDVTIIASRGLPNGHEIQVDDVSNQTIIEAIE